MPYAAYAGALCLDGPTLTNLELLESSAGSAEGSLLSCLDSCASAGGPLHVRNMLCKGDLRAASKSPLAAKGQLDSPDRQIWLQESDKTNASKSTRVCSDSSGWPHNDT